MERTMKEIIKENLGNYLTNAKTYNEDAFLEAVLDSFTRANTKKHYVVLIPVTLDEYYSVYEQNEFTSFGYSRMIREARFDNVFIAHTDVAKDMCKSLIKEDMHIDVAQVQNDKVFVITCEGIDESHFNYDHQITQ